MTPEQKTLQELKTAIEALSEDDRLRVRCIATSLRHILRAGGSHAAIALALVGAEMAAIE